MTALVELRRVAAEPEVHLVASVVLSSVLREASLQAPEDLRVRRRRGDFTPPRLAHLIARASRRAVSAIRELDGVQANGMRAQVVVGDAGHPGTLQALRGGHRRASVITSPPYATALPYVDTDRLSLIALGVVRVDQLRSLEAELIGSREWRGAEERAWNSRLEENADGLPHAITELCGLIRDSSEPEPGFRRRAVPGLLYRYFVQMRRVFLETRATLRTGERAVFIVGLNRTGKGEHQVTIETPRLLAELAASTSFRVDEILPLDVWPRYNLHHKNGIRGESAVLLTAA